ncbi:MAG TPA: glucokinase [Terriglobales bacterium]|nr:glucokinase [Terriglobales bacterium]
MILAGDIGGTHARLAFFSATNGRLQLVSEAAFPSRQYLGLEEIVSKFVRKESEPVEAACFGVAGPVRNGRAETSNLPWIVESSRLARELNLASTFLINDLEANAWGISALQPEDLVPLNHGASRYMGNQAVIAAGTGLGEAGIVWDGRQHRAFACEGGHADFGPRNDLQIALLQYLAKKFERVSYERLLSGPGLVNIYHFLRDTGRSEEPKWLAEAINAFDPAAAISKAALEGKCSLCEQALDLFVSIYGAEAGNLALKMLATGGVYVSGGIAPKILPRLKMGAFMDAFADKGRMRALLEAIPVHVIVNENAGLLGAARCAIARLALTI